MDSCTSEDTDHMVCPVSVTCTGATMYVTEQITNCIIYQIAEYDIC